MEALLRSEGWHALKRYLISGGRHHERVVRDKKANIETIRYSQGALDMQDLLTQHLTVQYVRDMRRAIAEAANLKRESFEQDAANT